MPRMIGEGFLPEAVQSQRNKLRNRLLDLREPIRSTREDLVPGPDVLGKVENTVKDFRDRVVTRESVIDRIQARRGNDGEQTKEQPDTESGSGEERPSLN